MVVKPKWLAYLTWNSPVAAAGMALIEAEIIYIGSAKLV